MFLPITQNQFYRKEPHLVMLGHIGRVEVIYLSKQLLPLILYRRWGLQNK